MGVSFDGLGNWGNIEGDILYWENTTCKIVGFGKAEGINGEYRISNFIKLDPLWFAQLQIEKSYAQKCTFVQMSDPRIETILEKGAIIHVKNFLWNLALEGEPIRQDLLEVEGI